MQTIQRLMIFGACGLYITACAHSPEVMDESITISSRPKLEEGQLEEREFARKYRELKNRNPAQDVQRALKNNKPHLLAFNAPRSGLPTVPGLLDPQGINLKCKTKRVDGLQGSVQSRLERRYRQALIQYMTQFNAMMAPYCQR